MLQKSTFSSGMFTLRAAVACALFCFAILLGTFSFVSLAAPSPAAGTLSTSNRTVTYSEPAGMQTPNDTGVALGQPVCIAPTDCSTFDLTIDPSIGAAASGYDPTQYQIKMTWSWAVATVDYDIFVEDSGGNNFAVNNSTADPSVIIIPTSAPAGVYHIVIVLAERGLLGSYYCRLSQPK